MDYLHINTHVDPNAESDYISETLNFMRFLEGIRGGGKI